MASAEKRQDEIWALAFAAARDAAERGEVPVGAVLVGSQGEILSVQGNRTVETNDPTAHAEVLALREAGSKRGSERLLGCDLYVTLEPCTMCAAALSLARIRRLYYAAADEKGGAVDNGVRFFNTATCHHRPEVYGGVRGEEASLLLRDFFKVRRER